MTKKEKRAYDKIYWQINKEKRKPYRQAYYKANKEKWEIYNSEVNQKAWREAHLGYYKAYRKANPEKKRESNRNRRASKHTTQIEPINEKVVYLRDGWICQICKKRVDKRFKHPNPMSPSLDHIVPLSEGGTHTYDNVQLAHLSCNFSKHTAVLPQGEQMRIF